MNKRLGILIAASLLLVGLTGCFNDEPDPEVVALEAKLEAMENERAQDAADKAKAEAEAEAEKLDKLEAEKEAKERELEDAAAEDKARLEKELAALKVQVNKPVEKAPAAQAPAASKFGPGNGNNLEGFPDGYLRIHTRSADGKLTLRGTASQNGARLTEISNGTDSIYYFDRVKIGEYVWYEVDYAGMIGYLRGDYVHRY